jgi:hypothetical protein
MSQTQSAAHNASCWRAKLNVTRSTANFHSSTIPNQAGNDDSECPAAPVSANQGIEGKRYRIVGASLDVARGLMRVAEICIRRLLIAMHESRRRQAMRTIELYANPDGRAEDLISAKPPVPEQTTNTSMPSSQTCLQHVESGVSVGERIKCPVTGAVCEGDLAHLCPDWGCARKAGLSPLSHENFGL